MSEAGLADDTPESIARTARTSARKIACASTAAKRTALRVLANELRAGSDAIIAENAIDLEQGRQDGLPAPLLDRLKLDAERIKACARGVEEIAALADPVGEVSGMRKMESGITVGRMRTPIGVVLVIYESRPSVTVDAGSLCLMSGNAAILRGGAEARRTNRVLGACFSRALAEAGIDPGCVQVACDLGREQVGRLLGMRGLIDVVIPRGGKGLINAVFEKSAIPVIKHLEGNCHIYVDASADLERATAIVDNAKTQRPGVCNAVETLLVHKDVAESFLPAVSKALLNKGVELRGCPRSARIIGDPCRRASDADWDEEFLDLILAVKVVDGLDDAIEHINRHGSMHTDGILTDSHARAWRFLREVDSSSVIVNASTRFADGGCYGLGAEIGISTDRIHARGPVGVSGLTIEKFVVLGDGQVRD